MSSRVEYLASPGNDMLLSGDLESFIARVEEFLSDSGLPLEDVVITPVVSIPMPITAQHDGERKRLAFRPELAWFPVFWLPLSVGLRYSIQEQPDGPLRIETGAEWALRVISQMINAGLFDPETGTWTDVLSMVGLDRNDHQVHERVLRWQQGESDPDLDHIDLSHLFTDWDETATAFTYLRAHQLLHTQWGMSAEQIIAQAERLEQIDELDEFTSEVEKWARIASLGFAGSPVSEQFQRISERLSVQSDPDEELDLLVKLARQFVEEHANALSPQTLA